MKIKIKEFKQMEKEFGISTVSDTKTIDCIYGFNHIMELLLPDDRIIEVLSRGNTYLWETDDNMYLISKDMIEATDV